MLLGEMWMIGEGVYDADAFIKMSFLFGVSMVFSKTSHALRPREGRNGRM